VVLPRSRSGRDGGTRGTKSFFLDARSNGCVVSGGEGAGRIERFVEVETDKSVGRRDESTRIASSAYASMQGLLGIACEA
jgi:hypothetical protein